MVRGTAHLGEGKGMLAVATMAEEILHSRPHAKVSEARPLHALDRVLCMSLWRNLMGKGPQAFCGKLGIFSFSRIDVKGVFDEDVGRRACGGWPFTISSLILFDGCAQTPTVCRVHRICKLRKRLRRKYSIFQHLCGAASVLPLHVQHSFILVQPRLLGYISQILLLWSTSTPSRCSTRIGGVISRLEEGVFSAHCNSAHTANTSDPQKHGDSNPDVLTTISKCACWRCVLIPSLALLHVEHFLTYVSKPNHTGQSRCFTSRFSATRSRTSRPGVIVVGRIDLRAAYRCLPRALCSACTCALAPEHATKNVRWRRRRQRDGLGTKL